MSKKEEINKLTPEYMNAKVHKQLEKQKVQKDEIEMLLKLIEKGTYTKEDSELLYCEIELRGGVKKEFIVYDFEDITIDMIEAARKMYFGNIKTQNDIVNGMLTNADLYRNIFALMTCDSIAEYEDGFNKVKCDERVRILRKARANDANREAIEAVVNYFFTLKGSHMADAFQASLAKKRAGKK